MTSQDTWSQRLLQTRFGGDADNAARELGRLRDIRDRIFTDDERSRFEEHLRPTVEAGGRTSRSAVAYLTATKERGMDTLDG